MEEKKNIRELAIQYFEGRILRKDEKLLFAYVGQIWGIERSGFFNGREKWAKGFENQRV